MQGRELRCAILIAVLLIGGALYARTGDQHEPVPQRWPTDDALFQTNGWSAEPESVESINGSTFVSRLLRAAEGSQANVTLVTSQNIKLFAAGAEVPFLGNGYDVRPAPVSLLPTEMGQRAFIAQRSSEKWLVFYAYGERRGLSGNGPMAWSLAIVDGLLGRSNDYYKLYLTVRLDDASGPAAPLDAGRLADTLFTRIANWYRD